MDLVIKDMNNYQVQLKYRDGHKYRVANQKNEKTQT